MNNEIHILGLLGPYIASVLAIIVSIVGLASIWGRMKETVEETKRKVEGLRHGLYQEDGTLVYVTQEHCLAMSKGLQSTTCAKIDEIKAAINDLSKQVREQQDSRAKEMQKLARFVGRVDHYISIQEKRELLLNEQ